MFAHSRKKKQHLKAFLFWQQYTSQTVTTLLDLTLLKNHLTWVHHHFSSSDINQHSGCIPNKSDLHKMLCKCFISNKKFLSSSVKPALWHFLFQMIKHKIARVNGSLTVWYYILLYNMHLKRIFKVFIIYYWNNEINLEFVSVPDAGVIGSQEIKNISFFFCILAMSFPS